jgi:hypothetical protein
MLILKILYNFLGKLFMRFSIHELLFYKEYETVLIMTPYTTLSNKSGIAKKNAFFTNAGELFVILHPVIKQVIDLYPENL